MSSVTGHDVKSNDPSINTLYKHSSKENDPVYYCKMYFKWKSCLCQKVGNDLNIWSTDRTRCQILRLLSCSSVLPVLCSPQRPEQVSDEPCGHHRHVPPLLRHPRTVYGRTGLPSLPSQTWWTGCTWRRQGPRSRSSLLSRMEGGSQSTHHHWRWWRFLEGWGSDTESDKERGRYQAGTAGSHKGRIALSWIWEGGCHLCEPEDYCSPSVRWAA